MAVNNETGVIQPVEAAARARARGRRAFHCRRGAGGGEAAGRRRPLGRRSAVARRAQVPRAAGRGALYVTPPHAARAAGARRSPGALAARRHREPAGDRRPRSGGASAPRAGCQRTVARWKRSAIGLLAGLSGRVPGTRLHGRPRARLREHRQRRLRRASTARRMLHELDLAGHHGLDRLGVQRGVARALARADRDGAALPRTRTPACASRSANRTTRRTSSGSSGRRDAVAAGALRATARSGDGTAAARREGGVMS